MPPIAVGGRAEQISLRDLDLDPANPRLPKDFVAGSPTQTEIALFIDKNHDPLRIAESISRHGFFASEPLIAIRGTDGRYIVVEGNRRLVALLGLSDAELRKSLVQQTRGWANLESVPRDAELPVVVVDDRSQVDALLGFRHISGIEPWDPFAQARFVSELVDRTGSFSDAARIVGRKEPEVRSMYRDHDIVIQAKERFGIDTRRVEVAFGVFNAAMGITNLRTFIDAPAPRKVDPESWPVPDEKRESTQRLIEYIYGDERGHGRVIDDSRQLQLLGRVLADKSGQSEAVLRRTRNLQAALDATVSNEEAARAQLQRASRSIRAAKDLINSNGFEPRVLVPLIDECSVAITEVREAVEATSK